MLTGRILWLKADIVIRHNKDKAKNNARIEVGTTNAGRNGQTQKIAIDSALTAIRLMDVIAELAAIERDFENQSPEDIAEAEAAVSDMARVFSMFHAAQEEEKLPGLAGIRKGITRCCDTLYRVFVSRKTNGYPG